MSLKLNTKLQTKWLENQKAFLLPLAILYLGFVITRITESGVSLQSFVPTAGEVTALVLYVLNAAYDYLRKLLG